MNDSAHEDAAATPAWLEELLTAAAALRELAQAQWQLLRSELRLARSAAMALVFITILAATLGIALGLTLLALIGLALTLWLGSWLWALLILAGVLCAGLFGTWVIARRCVYWLSLPGTRAQWRSLSRQPAPSATTSDAPGFATTGGADETD